MLLMLDTAVRATWIDSLLHFEARSWTALAELSGVGRRMHGKEGCRYPSGSGHQRVAVVGRGGCETTGADRPADVPPSRRCRSGKTGDLDREHHFVCHVDHLVQRLFV